CCAVRLPAPGISRSITNFGIWATSAGMLKDSTLQPVAIAATMASFSRDAGVPAAFGRGRCHPAILKEKSFGPDRVPRARSEIVPLPTYRRSVVPARPGAAALPLVAIVGRPNVGKSTLFNRLTRSRRSIVGDEPGITRDRIYGEFDWDGRSFRLVDTGGIIPDDPELIPQEIFNQARVALKEADALILVVDVRTELARPDYDLVRLLQRGGKPVFLAVNKVEGVAMASEAENFRRLGLREVYPISSEHGQGIGELLDAVAAALPAKATDEAPQDKEPAEIAEADSADKDNDDVAKAGQSKIRTHGEFEPAETSIAIIGRPNVGKST